MGMAHRGRLNVLANIIGKSPQEIFREFEDIGRRAWIAAAATCKYHLGYQQRRGPRRRAGRSHLTLCFNPSHLEFVNPVALGLTRAQAGPRARTSSASR